MNRKARPVKYQSPRDYVAANFATRTMRWTGIIVGLFLVFHLVDLTWGLNAVNPDFVRGEAYENLAYSLERPPVAGHLHRRQPRPRHPPLPRRLEPLPEPRLDQPPVQPPPQPDPPRLRRRVRRRRGGHQHHLPDRRPRRRRRRVELRGAPMSTITLDAKIPAGPIEEKWDNHKFDMKLVNPANKRKFDVIVVGTGLAGAAAAATLGELGYQVKAFTFHDSPRRAHSIAAQGGINAAKNYKNDGDSIYRLFYDTVKGGDFRAREANVYRLAQVCVDIIDQCVAQGVPFAREYGGLLDNRSFGGAQVSPHVLRPGPDRPAAPARRLPGAHAAGAARHGRAAHPDRDARRRRQGRRGRRHRRPRPRHRRDHELASAHAVVLGTGGYGNVFFLSTNAMTCNVTAAWRAHRKGAAVRQPLLHADPPDLHPGERRLPVEAHADVGVAAQRRPHLGPEEPRRDPARRPDPRGGARLLPRAPLPGVRQPRAPRRRVAAAPRPWSTRAAASAR